MTMPNRNANTYGAPVYQVPPATGTQQPPPAGTYGTGWAARQPPQVAPNYRGTTPPGNYGNIISALMERYGGGRRQM